MKPDDDYPPDGPRWLARRQRALQRLRESGGLVPLGADPSGRRRKVRITDDAAPILLADRLLVDEGHGERAASYLGARAVLRADPDGTMDWLDLVEFDLAEGEDVLALIDELAALDDPIDARPHHVVFAGYKGRILEGEDPEPAAAPVAKLAAGGPGLGAGAKVAVIDTGVAREALGLPLLADVTAQDPEDIDPKYTHDQPAGRPGPAELLGLGAGHGTFVAGVVHQVAPGCEIGMFRALDVEGTGHEKAVARAIRRAVEWGADIVNLSFGCYTAGALPPVLIERAIQKIPGRTIVVGASGNEGSSEPVWPGALRRVVSVAATQQYEGGDPDGGDTRVTTHLAPYSNRGWWVDVAAPGEWVSTFVTGQENPAREVDDSDPDYFAEPYALAAGTSFAAAAVSGAIAAEIRASGSDDAPRDALRRVLARTHNRTLEWGGRSLDIWGE